MSLASKLFGKTASTTDNDQGPSTSRTTSTRKAESQNPAEEELKRFIGKSPKSKYTFDSERDAPQSELCREVGDDVRKRECIMIQMQSRKLFEAMQDNGFFCALPLDPKQTYIECTPKPES